MIVTPRVLALFLKHEGLGQPWPVPPLETSGITIGYGYDLGQCSRDQFSEDWKDVLPPDHHNRLRSHVGLHGIHARTAAGFLRDIVIRKPEALKVLNRCINRYAAATFKAFPGLEKYPPDVQGAMCSLVYNRGAGMGDALKLFDGRQEMRDLRALIARGASCQEIGDCIEGMAYLWQDMGADGLITRRFEEAAIIKAADDPIGLEAA